MSRVPRIRFKGFEEDWEQRKLGEMAERIIRKNEKLESTLPLTISAQYGLIDQNEFFDKRIASKDVRGYYLIKKGEFAYNKSTSVDAPLGAIKRLDKYKNGVLSTLYILFKIIDDTSTSSDYLVTYYATDLWHRGIQSIAAEGARNHGLLNIAPNDFFETMLSIPLNISEQKKVGDFFISIDHLITLHQSKSFGHILKVIVSCTLSWEQRKLGEVFEEYSEKNHSELPPLTIIQGGGTIRRDESDRALQYDKGSLSNYKMVNKGDFIVHLRSFEGGLEKANSTGIISPAYHTFSGENTDTTFYYAYFRSEKFIESDLKPHVYGIRDGRSIDIEGMKSINIPHTIFDEQSRIGEFIDSINHLITLHQLEPFQLIFKAIAYRIIDYAKSKPPRSRK